MSSGCGRDNGVVTVRGAVTFQGKPVEDAAVMFLAASGGSPSLDRTDEAGYYEVLVKLNDEATAELFYVTIAALEESVAGAPTSDGSAASEEQDELLNELRGGPGRPRWRIPQRYANVKTSGLSLEVQPNHENAADFHLVK